MLFLFPGSLELVNQPFPGWHDFGYSISDLLGFAAVGAVISLIFGLPKALVFAAVRRTGARPRVAILSACGLVALVTGAITLGFVVIQEPNRSIGYALLSGVGMTVLIFTLTFLTSILSAYLFLTNRWRRLPS
ncbi:hypothetical protein NOG11_14210 [Parvularcula sp. BGMRC 0090]|uniref:Uncharacterized protein n=1 Tax=Parvularcula maris TaxID=2965077 RepID=A0A9X2LB84_9PROT|nr:hypothetical protein [Parvularcula maris]